MPPATNKTAAQHTTATDAHKQQLQTVPPPGYKLNPLYVETKSERVQLLLQPSTVDRLRAKAKTEKTSVNSLINTLLIDALDNLTEEGIEHLKQALANPTHTTRPHRKRRK